MGMLVWAEPANPTAFTPDAREALRRDLLAMVERDFNRPSVIDPDAMRARLSGSKPPWFVRSAGGAATEGGIQTIAGYEQRVVSAGLADVFPTVQQLITTCRPEHSAH
jgi:hypothetical protein